MSHNCDTAGVNQAGKERGEKVSEKKKAVPEALQNNDIKNSIKRSGFTARLALAVSIISLIGQLIFFLLRFA